MTISEPKLHATQEAITKGSEDGWITYEPGHVHYELTWRNEDGEPCSSSLSPDQAMEVIRLGKDTVAIGEWLSNTDAPRNPHDEFPMTVGEGVSPLTIGDPPYPPPYRIGDPIPAPKRGDLYPAPWRDPKPIPDWLRELQRNPGPPKDGESVHAAAAERLLKALEREGKHSKKVRKAMKKVRKALRG